MCFILEADDGDNEVRICIEHDVGARGVGGQVNATFLGHKHSLA